MVVTVFPDENTVSSEIAIREGSGFVTTQSKKEQDDKKLALFEERMTKLVTEALNAMNIQPKIASSSTPPPPPAPAPNNNNENENTKQTAPDPKILDMILKFNKTNLKPTETKETHLSDYIKPKDKLGHHKVEDIKEMCESDQAILDKVKHLAKLIRKSQHLVVYTGAGISTSAQLPDYRGTNGCWTRRDQGLAPLAPKVTIEQAFPTFTHYAIAEMACQGIVKHVVSTNVDGLHLRSGLPFDKISELHGNCFREKCSSCGKSFLQYFDVTNRVQDYRTHVISGRSCSSCGAKNALRDTIIHFNEYLPEDELNTATKESDASDLALVLGTSMMVNPAATLPARTQGSLVIVNLQKTPYDSQSNLRIFAKCDEMMKMLCEELGIKIDLESLHKAEIEKRKQQHGN